MSLKQTTNDSFGTKNVLARLSPCSPDESPKRGILDYWIDMLDLDIGGA